MIEPQSVPLPSFENPPVNEVICGIMFNPIEGLLAPHLGLLWSKFRAEFPTCKEVDPLLPAIEMFDGNETGLPGFNIPFLPRIWFVSKDETEIIQVQRDRLLHNWRKIRPSDEYPRYGVVKKKFGQHCAEFEAFLVEHQLGAVKPVQFEMTYHNHIPAGNGWHAFDELGKVLPDFVWRSGPRFFGPPENVNWRTTFILPENQGRMHLVIQTALRRQDRLPILVVELTVRGIGSQRTIEAMWPWFDLAREWIVRGFADITGGDVQKNIWRRTA